MTQEKEHWADESEKILAFHEQKQKEKGVARVGRPDTFVGHQGWGVRDTCKELKISVRKAVEALRIGRALRANPKLRSQNRSMVLGRSVKNPEIEDLIGTLRTVISKLKMKKSPEARILDTALTVYERRINERRNQGRSKTIHRRSDELPESSTSSD